MTLKELLLEILLSVKATNAILGELLEALDEQAEQPSKKDDAYLS